MTRKVVRNHEVAIAWKEGREARSNNGNFHTDGKNLYSYSMQIGRTAPDGTKEALAAFEFSITTTQHVYDAVRNADRRIAPAVAPARHGFPFWLVFPDDPLATDAKKPKIPFGYSRVLNGVENGNGLYYRPIRPTLAIVGADRVGTQYHLTYTGFGTPDRTETYHSLVDLLAAMKKIDRIGMWRYRQ